MLSGSPHGSVMSCQSLAARAFSDKDMTHCTFHRSVRFSSESRGSGRASDNEKEKKERDSGSVSLPGLPAAPAPPQCPAMTQSAPSNSLNFDLDNESVEEPSCRFPKLEECAHFHYERVSLGGLSVQVLPEDQCQDNEEGYICLQVRTHVSGTSASEPREWTLSRSRDHLRRLDEILHRCIYDRKVSGLPNLSMDGVACMEGGDYRRLVSDYMHHLSIIADDSINCGPALNCLQMDNKGHKLLVANEDSSSINTPAVAAAYSVRKYVSQARDEISFDVGDMISIIDMPGPQESLWWRGKRGFRVGFFPHHCVAVIGDKVPRNMTQPPPIVGSVCVAPIKPVLRKHGKLISLFRSFILSRPSRRSLKQQGILRERVFGCDLGEHLLNNSYTVPLVLVECAAAIESRGAVDGVYRLSGGSGLTQRLRAAFDSGAAPDLSPAAPDLARDPHAVPSLLKMYFRELPNPLCTYQLYDSFVAAVQLPAAADRLRAVRRAAVKLPPPHYRTLSYLMRHLRRVSLLGAQTGMTPRNMAIVWAPNLLRAPTHHHALQGVAVQAVVTEFLICYAEELFAQEQGADSEPESLEQEIDLQVELRGTDSCRRPKSLPLNPPTKLLSLEEARRRGGSSLSAAPPPAALAAGLRPASNLKYIEVGSGPNNLPQYHTVLELPLSGTKRGLKRSPSGWRGLFSRSHKQRARPAAPRAAPRAAPDLCDVRDSPMPCGALRPVKSCESLASDCDTLAPLRDTKRVDKHHTRSSSCDSYFEPWQAELADMRLRLSPQERDRHMFSEEDDTQVVTQQDDSLCSSPPESGLCSVDPSPRRNLRLDISAANELAEKRRLLLEEQISSLSYIDGTRSPRARPPPEKRAVHAPQAHTEDRPKRICKDKDRDSPKSSTTEFHTSPGAIKLRDRTSPRKVKNNRYSSLHAESDKTSRLSWHGKDGHSTLIRVDWPGDSITNLTSSTINSCPITPNTPNYEALETDSESDNKQTIKISNCKNCEEETCLKCELKASDFTESSPVHSDLSYKNFNRLSAVSTSSDEKLKVMTSSHESTSSYSNTNSHDYECCNFKRPSYINLSCSSKSSATSPLKSPLKSTISITFRSPTKSKEDRDSVYEDIVLDNSLSIVEDATIPNSDASLPTQQACQPDFNNDLIILESPTETHFDTDVYSQVKFFKQSIEEVNAMIYDDDRDKDVLEESVFIADDYTDENATEEKDLELQSCDYVPQEANNHYENVQFNDYENINVNTLKICDKLEITEVPDTDRPNADEADNGNKKEKNLNVRELAIRFESPTEQKGPFTFEKFKAEIKYPSLERKDTVKVTVKSDPKQSPKSHKLTKNSNSARSLDENAFVKEFGTDRDRRKSLEVRDANQRPIKLPDLNLNIEEKKPTTPTTENKISLIQRFNEPEPKTSPFDSEKKLSRERIEKYKEERRNFLREKYSSQSFRSSPEQLTRIKIKKDVKEDNLPKFERRNTVDLGQRMRFSLAKSANNLDTIQSPVLSPTGEFAESSREDVSRKEKMSPSLNIKDMAALFEKQNPSG